MYRDEVVSDGIHERWRFVKSLAKWLSMQRKLVSCCRGWGDNRVAFWQWVIILRLDISDVIERIGLFSVEVLVTWPALSSCLLGVRIVAS